MKKILSVAFVLFFACTTFLQAQNTPQPVKWTFESKKISETEYDVVLKATIEKGWYLYSQYLQDGGPVPTSIQFKEEKGITIADKIEEKGLAPKSGYDELFQMDITKYAQEVTFTARVKQKKAAPATLQGSVEFMTCDDTKCLPPDQVDFSFELK